METLNNILEIKDLSVGFNIDKQFYYVFKGINLTFEKGKIHAIAGESGCGKSVFVNTILNLLPKNAKIMSGQIIFKGIDLLNLKEKTFRGFRGKLISLIPQNPFMSLNPLYTIENQLMEVTSLKGKDKKEALEIIKKALLEVRIQNIDTVLASYPHELSGGMKQRIIIAMALISDSELILADEPTTALDVSVSNSILDLLLELKNKGKTIILITHDLSIVSNYCDTTTIMYLGDIVESAKSSSLFKTPLHPYTKALLEALPTKKGKKLKNIKGQISPLTSPVEGCKFHPRCEFVMDKCSKNKPNITQKQTGSVACFLYDSFKQN